MRGMIVSIVCAFALQASAQEFPGQPFAISGGGGLQSSALSGYWKTDGSSSPSTGAWTLGNFNLTVDTSTFFLNATTDCIGIRQASCTHVLEIVAGSLTNGQRAQLVSATFPASASTQIGVRHSVTTVTGQSASSVAEYVELLPGYTGSAGNTHSLIGENTVAGTGRSE